MAWKALSASSISKGGKDRGCYILKKLCEKWGCQPVNAVGSVGCFYCESQCDPTQYNKAEKNSTFKGSSANGSGYGAGIAQWSLDWKARIQQQFRRYTPIETWSLDQQIEIVLQTCKPTFINKLKACSTCTDSTDIWLRGYENGGGGSGGLCSKAAIDKYTWCNGYYGAMQNRSTAAIEILKAYTGGNVGEGVQGNIEGASSGAGQMPADFSGPTVESSYDSVLAMSSDNMYSNIQVSNDDKIKHTRIYKYSAAKVKVDEMSLQVDGQTTTISTDVGTGNTTATSDTSTNTGTT